MTEKLALGGAGVVLEGVGRVVFSGTGERDVVVGRADVRDGDGDGEEDEGETDGEEEVAEKAGEIGTCGIDGSTTLG
ncbi:hypothetical protein ACIA5D_12090 [Actinoplanes sp. NPDC051513]|uniref:hypothetical protein n=1 Tax=Actinoplanes sp. NPDC051513 TaxID=3363908 RepID=UPI00379B26E7